MFSKRFLDASMRPPHPHTHNAQIQMICSTVRNLVRVSEREESQTFLHRDILCALRTEQSILSMSLNCYRWDKCVPMKLSSCLDEKFGQPRWTVCSCCHLSGILMNTMIRVILQAFQKLPVNSVTM